MKALVYLGPNRKSFEDRSKPVITAPTDPIVEVTRATIRRTDRHVPGGDVPTCTPGHEGVGIVDALSSAVTAFDGPQHPPHDPAGRHGQHAEAAEDALGARVRPHP